ncbi:MAG: ABC transporter ATP-binding protein [Nitrospinota bacterium]
MKTHRRLLRYLWPHQKELGAVTLTMLLGIGIEILKPWPMKLLLDQVLGQQPLPGEVKAIASLLPGSAGTEGLLLWVCIGTLVLFLAGWLMTTANLAYTVRLGQCMVFDLGADIFLHLQKLSLLFHSRRAVGDTVARVTGDAYCVNALIAGAMLPALQSLIMLVAMFFVMWQLEPTMTLLALTVTPFLVLSIRIFGQAMRARGRERRTLEGQMMSMVTQALSAIPAVQAFTREEIEQQRFRSYADQTVTAYERSALADMWFKLFVGLVTSAGTAAIMYLGARYALQGKVTVGTIILFLSYLQSLYAPLNALTYTASTIQDAAARAERVMEILDTPLDVQDAPDARDLKLRGRVRVRGVSFGYEESRPVLRDINFHAEPGEMIAIVGPTGAGKTTLVSLLLRFYNPWTGAITIDGEDIRRLRLRSLREQVAIVLQEPFIFPLSAAENIAYGRPDATREQIAAAAAAANADEFIRRLPQGYGTVIGERGATLSGGEKQRLSIARAFLKDAPILVLDEPTSALDARTEGLLLDALDRLMKGRTTFIIAHRLSTIRNADRILVLDRGQIVETGTHSELVTVDGLYASLYRQQMEIARHEPIPAAPGE